MSEENDNEETVEETPAEEPAAEETPVEEAPAEEPKAEEAPPEDAPAEEPAAEEAPAEEPAAEEAPAEEAAADEASADDAPAGDADSGGDGDGEPSKFHAIKAERKRARREAKTEAGAQLSPEERHEQRQVERRRKAASRSRWRKRRREKRAAAGPREGTPPAEREAGTAQVRQGVVTSDKADKTITVRVDIAKRHPKYQKIVRSSKKLHVHDEANDLQVGDRVRVQETRPLSKLKRWRLVDIIERAK